MGPFPLLTKSKRKNLTIPTIITPHPLSYPTPLNVRVKQLQKNLFCVNDSIYGNKQLQLAECEGGRNGENVGESSETGGGQEG
jgi:hypothetical protein